MAKQTIGVGSAPNDNTGDKIRDAFIKVNSNFDELYTDDASDVNSITATAPIARDSATGAVTISLADAGISTAKIADDAVTADKLANSINSEIAANTAKVTNATHTGDVTGSGALTIAADAVTTAKILNDNVTHDKLEARYTTTAAAVTTSGATTIDWSAHASFPITMGGAHTLNFSNYKIGQVIDLIISGAHAVTLGTTTGTPVFNKVGSQSYDTTTTNIIQVMCTDDDSTPNFFFAIGTYAVAQPQ